MSAYSLFLFFFKQKTAYEMRISDWSSDVCSSDLIPAMIQNGGGAIVNLSSIAAQGVAGRALRSATKAALNSLTVAMALDHGPQNVRVNAVLIGPDRKSVV